MTTAIYEVIGENGAACQNFGVNGGDIISIPKGSYITLDDIKIGRFDEHSIAGLIHDGVIKELEVNKIKYEDKVEDEDVVDDEKVVNDDSEFTNNLDNKKMPEKLTGKKRGRPRNDA